MEIQHRSHRHMLTLCELKEEIMSICCNGCDQVTFGPGYVCQTCLNRQELSHFRLHKSCAELPGEICHPLHPLHSLILDDVCQNSGFICDGCRDFSQGFTFKCRWCEFNLDVKCALITDESRALSLREKEIYPFYHEHKLNLCNFREPYRSNCHRCNQMVSGSAYACIPCQMFFHESCADIPQEVQHLFHRQHPIRPDAVGKYESRKCHTCKDRVFILCLRCPECNLDFHLSCVSPFTRELKHKCHNHNLFCFVHNVWYNTSFKCNNCNSECCDSFYRCFECDIDFHPECIPLPRVVKHKWHKLHPLTFMKLFVEDDSGEYYCDVCETQRDPKHPVYYCEECSYIVHVECVISEDDSSLEILSYLEPRPKVEARQHNDAGNRGSNNLQMKSCNVLFYGWALIVIILLLYIVKLFLY